MSYAVCCKACGHIEEFAWVKKEGKDEIAMVRSTTPLTARGQVPAYCQKCGQRNWRVPATEQDIEKAKAKAAREARASELCGKLDMDGLFKIPDEVKAPPEVKNALSHLLAPLEGETLKQAQGNIIKVAKSGVAADAEVWVEMYDRAVQKAIKPTKGASHVPA